METQQIQNKIVQRIYTQVKKVVPPENNWEKTKRSTVILQNKNKIILKQ